MLPSRGPAVSFGKSLDAGRPSQPFPGISSTRFDPVAAQKCWAEAIGREKLGRYVHQELDARHRLGLDRRWAKSPGVIGDLLPDFSSLSSVYRKLGWKVLHNGRLVAPDPQAWDEQCAREGGPLAPEVDDGREGLRSLNRPGSASRRPSRDASTPRPGAASDISVQGPQEAALCSSEQPEVRALESPLPAPMSRPVTGNGGSQARQRDRTASRKAKIAAMVRGALAQQDPLQSKSGAPEAAAPGANATTQARCHVAEVKAAPPPRSKVLIGAMAKKSSPAGVGSRRKQPTTSSMKRTFSAPGMATAARAAARQNRARSRGPATDVRP